MTEAVDARFALLVASNTVATMLVMVGWQSYEAMSLQEVATAANASNESIDW
ncbi:MAG: hypothetical protein JWO05_3547 [Gemmatimonadetes bacterium]|nr:hypothetical protein [Gemmatimonadota bacterium]